MKVEFFTPLLPRFELQNAQGVDRWHTVLNVSTQKNCKNFSAALTYKCILSFSVERMAPMETSTVQFEIIPYRSGTRQLQVDLVCTHFSDIKGFVMLDVAPAP